MLKKVGSKMNSVFRGRVGLRVLSILMLLTLFVCAIPSMGVMARNQQQSVIDGREVTKIAETVRDIIKDISFPIGAALIFASVVIISIKIIVSHSNPNKRGEAMGGLAWVAIGAILLGSSLIVAGIITNLGGLSGDSASIVEPVETDKLAYEYNSIDNILYL